MSEYELAIAIGLPVMLLVMLAGGLWVGLSLMVLGFAALQLGADIPVGKIMATSIWGKSAEWTLTALPLFIWMGEILSHTRMSQDLFLGLSPWMRHIPGRLMHVNILGCAVFAAVCGSSAATAATIGKITLPELRKRGYQESVSIGTLAGSATLGLLIPPSIIMIVYGIAAEVSIARLFIAGILPACVAAALFMIYVMVTAPAPKGIDVDKGPLLRRDNILATLKLIPTLILIVAIIMSIYLGLATPTEAAALGVFGALVISLTSGSLTWAAFKSSVRGATITSCMISLILAGAAFLSVSMGFLGIPKAMAAWVAAQNVSPYVLLLFMSLLFIFLGCFLDGISIIVLTTSVTLPLIQAAGIDLIWFGVYLVIITEISQITPPVGFNLFVIQSLTGKNILEIAVAALPYFFLLVVTIVMLTIFPQIVTSLPDLMMSR